jgi:predicted chitinase
MINREKFFQGYKEKFGSLNQSQVDNLNFLLDKLDDSFIDDLRHYAYILATIKHETAETYKPITEYGSRAYLRRKKYYPYIGRGFVQLTWDWNYDKFGNALDIDLIGNPQMANEPETAWKILELGMTSKRVNFTGKVLSDYFNDNKTDWINARRIINGTDRAKLVGGYAETLYKLLEVA